MRLFSFYRLWSLGEREVRYMVKKLILSFFLFLFTLTHTHTHRAIFPGSQLWLEFGEGWSGAESHLYVGELSGHC